MAVRTDTDCSKCEHQEVCYKKDRPKNATEEIANILKTDMNGIDIVVSCANFHDIVPQSRIREISFPIITDNEKPIEQHTSTGWDNPPHFNSLEERDIWYK